MIKLSVNLIRKIKLYFVHQNVHVFVLQIDARFAGTHWDSFNHDSLVSIVHFKLLVFYLKQNDLVLLAKILIYLFLIAHHVLEIDHLYVFE